MEKNPSEHDQDRQVNIPTGDEPCSFMEKDPSEHDQDRLVNIPTGDEPCNLHMQP
jgi:hypothetical protein